MEPMTKTQLHGAIELVRDAVDAVAAASETAQQSIAHRPYAVLALIPVISGPAQRIECLQGAVTAVVYGAVRGINRLAGSVASGAVATLPE